MSVPRRLEDVRLIARLSRVERGHLKGQLLEQAHATMKATADTIGPSKTSSASTPDNTQTTVHGNTIDESVRERLRHVKETLAKVCSGYSS